jgi:phosphoglycerol transferase
MHMFLANYAMVPLAVLVAVALAAGVDLRLWGAGASAGPRRRMLGAMLIIAAVTCSGVYYGFFTAFLLCVGGLLGAVRAPSLARILAPAILLAVSALTLTVNLLPTIFYAHSHGTDREVATRWASQTDFYALKLTYLLLPNRAHRSPAMQKLFDAYESTQFPDISESNMAAIGWVAGFGFVVLIGVILLQAIGVQVPRPLGYLAALNLAAVLLGTQGGLGSLLSYFVSASLRSFTRISIVIAFLSLATVLILLGRILDPMLRQPRRRIVGFALLCALAALAMYDQIPLAENPSRIAASWTSDAEFVKRIERAMPAGSMIFEAPYDPFPESPPIRQLRDYDLFRGYIHSTTLRWSYGAMRGREMDRWQREISHLSIPKLVEALRKKGFAGIYVDRNAYSDPDSMTLGLQTATGSNGFTSADGRLVFFAIRPTSAD